MTLHSVVVAAGVVLSISAFYVLAALWPFGRRRALCLKAGQDPACERRCLRTCHLEPMSGRELTRIGPTLA